MKISECCNLISGNSTGGIIACLLSIPEPSGKAKYSAKQITEFYLTYGKDIFHRGWIRALRTLNGLIGTKYSPDNLEQLLQQYCGNVRLCDTLTNLLIPTYQVTRRPVPYFFKSTHARIKTCGSAQNPYLWECARATSAASSYFPPYKLNAQAALIDGGIFANNPSVCAYAQAKKLWGYQEQILLISLGTGKNLKGLDYNKIRNWGIVQWAVPYFQQTSISADESIDYILRTFTNANQDLYYNFQVQLDDKCSKMDDASESNLVRLQNYARQLIQEKGQALDDVCMLLKSACQCKM